MAGKGVSKGVKEEFIKAVKEGDFETFSSLLSEGILRARKNNLPLWLLVIKRGSREMVKEAVRIFLSNQKEPVKLKGKWVEVVMALKRVEALKVMCKEFREYLLEKREFFKGREEKLVNQLLIELAREGKVEGVELLLKEFTGELNPNIQDEAGNTPLHYGAYRGDYRIIKLLLDGGGNLSVPNSLGLTPEGILKFKGIRVGV